MPSPKKPSKPARATSRASKPAPKSASKPAPKSAAAKAKRTAKSAAKSAAKPAAKRPASRAASKAASRDSAEQSGSRSTRDAIKASLREDPQVEERPSLLEAVREEEEAPSRPVAIGSATSAGSLLDSEPVSSTTAEAASAEAGSVADGPLAAAAVATSDAPEPSHVLGAESGPATVDRPTEELLVGGFCLALLLSVLFLPWYRIGSGPTAPSVSGWASGTWGPIIAFLALAGAAIVGLRRFRIPIRFPLDATLVMEGIGWLSVLGILAKRWRIPDGMTSTGALLFSLAFAFGVAFFGGRLSTNTPIVVLPNWLRQQGGKLGVGILAGALLLGLFFGFTNEPFSTGGFAGGGQAPSSRTVSGRLPDCAKDEGIAVPAGFKPTTGTEPIAGSPLEFCSVVMETDVKMATAVSRLKASLKKAGFKVSNEVKQQSIAVTMTLSDPRCGTASVQDRKTSRTATIFLLPCSTLPESRP